MIDDEKRIETILTAIGNKSDYSLIGKLELVNNFKNDSEFKNFVLILLILIEKSSWYESASSLLIKKIYHQDVFTERKISEAEYGDLFISVLKEKALPPFTGITTAIRRLIASIIYDKTNSDTNAITEITPKEKLLSANEYFLERYLSDHVLDSNAMLLYYNCVEDIHPETSQITLSPNANSAIRSKIEGGDLLHYLSIFIRPLYFSHSPNFPDASFHVPEPFYRQIFGSNENFIERLNQEISNNPDEKLLKEINNFMEIYNANVRRGINHVDVDKQIDWDRGLHLNAKFTQ